MALPRRYYRVFPHPDTMEWQDWADSVVGFNNHIGLAQKIDPNLGWYEFAERVAEAVPNTPHPEGFEDWRAWARSVRNALAL
jgi:hypothetical protein